MIFHNEREREREKERELTFGVWNTSESAFDTFSSTVKSCLISHLWFHMTMFKMVYVDYLFIIGIKV